MSYKEPHKKGGRFEDVPGTDMVTWVADDPKEERRIVGFSLNRWTDVSVAVKMLKEAEWQLLLQRAMWEGGVTVFTLRLSLWRMEVEIEFDYVKGGR